MQPHPQSPAGSGRITGIFPDRASAERVFDAIRDRGYDRSEIDVIMTEDSRATYFPDNDSGSSEMGDRAMEGAGVGSAIGGTIGAIIGAVAAIGTTILLPGIGLVVAGPIAAALAGAGAGGFTGGLLGALVGTGIPKEESEEFEQTIRGGGIAIAVEPKDAEDAHFLRELFGRNAAGQVYDSHLRPSDPDYNAGHSEASPYGHPRTQGSSHRVSQSYLGDRSSASIPGILGESYNS